MPATALSSHCRAISAISMRHERQTAAAFSRNLESTSTNMDTLERCLYLRKNIIHYPSMNQPSLVPEVQVKSDPVLDT